jgi:hypothetical protein
VRERETRGQRRKSEQARLVAEGGDVLLKPEALAEVQTSAERVARLRRILDLSELNGKAELLARAGAALARESQRHEAAMRALNGGEADKTSEEYARAHTRRPQQEGTGSER